METLIDNEYVSLYYHEDKNMIHHIYKHGIHGKYLEEALTTGTDHLIKHNATKWLSDNRAIDGVTDEESEWINTVWLPRTMEAGWKFWALVVPEKAMAAMNMTQFIHSFSEQGVRCRVFADPEKAMAWLDSLTDEDVITV